jgi:hypothetical protein
VLRWWRYQRERESSVSERERRRDVKERGVRKVGRSSTVFILLVSHCYTKWRVSEYTHTLISADSRRRLPNSPSL